MTVRAGAWDAEGERGGWRSERGAGWLAGRDRDSVRAEEEGTGRRQARSLHGSVHEGSRTGQHWAEDQVSYAVRAAHCPSGAAKGTRDHSMSVIN